MFCSLLGIVIFLVNTSASPRVEQRVTLKFLVKGGRFPIECWRSLHDVWGDQTMLKTQVRVWHKRFRNGSEVTGDQPRPGRPRTQCTEENKQIILGLIESNPRRSLVELSEATGISTHVVRTILKKDLCFKKKSAKFIPRELSEPQKWTRMTVAQDNIDLLCSKDDPEQFLQTIITGDETWVSTYEPNSKKQTQAWLSPDQERPKKALSASVKKTMLTAFFDCKGIVMIEFLTPGDTVKASTYIKTLAKLKECIRKKHPTLWSDRSFVIHHDNASPHTAGETMTKVKEWGLTILEHPPYSPDLAPCDFALFPKLKSQIRGRNFPNLEALKAECRKTLHALPSLFFADAMHDMVYRWQKCAHVNREYFEGDHIVVEPLFTKDSGSESDGTMSEDDAN